MYIKYYISNLYRGEAVPNIRISKARESFSETLNRVAFGGERVVLERHGRAIAALIPIDDLRLLEELEDQVDVEAARRALAEADREGTIAWDDLRSREPA